MYNIKTGTPIRKWVNDRAAQTNVVKNLAELNNVSMSTVYKYIECDRDIRVTGGHIFEIKSLAKESK